MRYLLDTNIVSEPARIRPDAGVLSRLRRHRDDVCIAAPVLHELLIPELHDASRHLMQPHSHDEEIVIQLTTMHQETIKTPCATLPPSQTWYADRASIPSQTTSLLSRGQGEIE